MPITINLPEVWRARPYQRKLCRYLRDGGRRAIVVAHRRWGKDEVALHWAAQCAMLKPASTGTCCRNTARPAGPSGMPSIRTPAAAASTKRFPTSSAKLTREDDMLIRFREGAAWQVVGSDNYDRLVGTPPAGIVFSEWALADPAAWAYFAPILAENGGWALFLTTPRGRNHAAEMFAMAQASPDWFAELQTVEDTGVLTRGQIEEQRREYHAVFGEDAGDALIEQEYWCSWSAAVLGAYWAKEVERAEKDGRIAPSAGAGARGPYRLGPRHRRCHGDLVVAGGGLGDPHCRSLRGPRHGPRPLCRGGPRQTLAARPRLRSPRRQGARARHRAHAHRDHDRAWPQSEARARPQAHGRHPGGARHVAALLVRCRPLRQRAGAPAPVPRRVRRQGEDLPGFAPPRFHQPLRRRLPLPVHGLARPRRLGFRETGRSPGPRAYTLNELFEIAEREKPGGGGIRI